MLSHNLNVFAVYTCYLKLLKSTKLFPNFPTSQFYDFRCVALHFWSWSCILLFHSIPPPYQTLSLWGQQNKIEVKGVIYDQHHPQFPTGEKLLLLFIRTRCLNSNLHKRYSGMFPLLEWSYCKWVKNLHYLFIFLHWHAIFVHALSWQFIRCTDQVTNNCDAKCKTMHTIIRSVSMKEIVLIVCVKLCKWIEKKMYRLTHTHIIQLLGGKGCIDKIWSTPY